MKIAPVALSSIVWLACSDAPRAPGSAQPSSSMLAPAPPAPPASIGAASASAFASAAPVEPPSFPPPPGAPAGGPKIAGDGEWTPVPVSWWDPSPIVKTVVHPPGGSNVYVAAFDYAKIEFGLVAGYVEPEQAVVPPGHRLSLIPKESVDRVLAITNGGFKRKHGQHGFKIGDDVYIPPKDVDCTVAVTKSGELRIGTWTRLAPREAELAWYRQAGPCLVEDGVKTKDAAAPFDGWKYGTSMEGGKDVRRSAYAMSKDGRVLYFAIGDVVDPNALADALVALHVEAACQFDINFSFTRLVVFDRDDKGEPVGSSPLMKGLVFAPEEGWKTPAQRDFFYMVRKPIAPDAPR